MIVHNSPIHELNDWFEKVVARSSGNRTATFDAPMSAYRRGDDVWMHVDLPGVAADTLDVSVERNVLTITGSRIWEREDGDHVYLDERRSGTHCRQVTLGEGFDTDHIEADYTDGVLTLRISVAEQTKPRKITIGGHTEKAVDTDSTKI